MGSIMSQFNPQCLKYAELVQCPHEERGWGYIYCARCGDKIGSREKKKKRLPCQKIPSERGGRFNKENCMLVCGECYDEIMKERE